MIIDANLVTYWFVESPFSTAVVPLLQEEILLAPNLLRVEVAASLLKYVRGNYINQMQVQTIIQNLDQLISEFVPDEELLASAVNISVANSHSIYDCLYLALARERNVPLVTADKRLATLAKKLLIETQLIKPSL